MLTGFERTGVEARAHATVPESQLALTELPPVTEQGFFPDIWNVPDPSDQFSLSVPPAITVQTGQLRYRQGTSISPSAGRIDGLCEMSPWNSSILVLARRWEANIYPRFFLWYLKPVLEIIK